MSLELKIILSDYADFQARVKKTISYMKAGIASTAGEIVAPAKHTARNASAHRGQRGSRHAPCFPRVAQAP